MRYIIAVLVATITLGLAGQAAHAKIEVGDTMRLDRFEQGQSQGPFKALVLNQSSTDPDDLSVGAVEFKNLVFCTESGPNVQYFTPGTTYTVSGVGASTTSNWHLTGYAAWVYKQFRNWQLPTGNSATISVNYDSPDDSMRGIGSDPDYRDELNAFQNAIWSGIVNTGDSSNWATAINAGPTGSPHKSIKTVNQATLSSVDGLNISYNYFVSQGLDVTDISGTAIVQIGSNQDQLIAITDEAPEVPEPASLAIWSLIAAGGAVAAGSRRRRRNRWSDDNRQAIRSIIARK